MWKAERELKQKKVLALSDGRCVNAEEKETNQGKMSSAMAMVLGAFVTLELLIAGAMMFNIDFHGIDGIALGFVFMVLYFGVVAVLTDK